MTRLVAHREDGYCDLADLRRRAGVSAAALDRLARADAFGSLELDRRGALWRAIGLDQTGRELDLPPLFAWAEGRTAPAEPGVALPRMTLGQEVAEDYASLRLTLRRHPLALLRPWLDRRVVKAERLTAIDDGRWVEVAGLVLVRQRPGTASGVIFITIEDESGVANLVVWPAVFERFRRVVLGAQLMAVRGRVQKEGLVIHIVAETLIDRTDLLRRLAETDHALEAPVARADRVKRPSDFGRHRRRAARPRRSRRHSPMPTTPRTPARPIRAIPVSARAASGSSTRSASSINPSDRPSPAPTRSSATPAMSASSIPRRPASDRATSTDAARLRRSDLRSAESILRARDARTSLPVLRKARAAASRPRDFASKAQQPEISWSTASVDPLRTQNEALSSPVPTHP